MSDTFKIKYSSKDQFFVMAQNKVSAWITQLEKVESKLMVISNMSSFQGTTADSVKAYINDVYGILLISIRQTLADFQSRLTLYTNGFYAFEPNYYAIITEDTMKQVEQKSVNERQYLAEKKTSIGRVLDSISDLISLNNPSQTNVTDAMQDMEGQIQTLQQSISDHEQVNASDVNGDLGALISSLYEAINAYVLAQGCITGYQSGDYAQKTEILDLYKKVSGSMDYTAEVSDQVSDAAENMQKVFIQQQKDYEEACEARKDEGMANFITGGLAVVGGITAIVLTAGAATPVVVVATVSGTCAATYGVSNMVEGGQDMYYGHIGDLSTEAWNPVRDTVFCGNQQLYDTWGSLSLTVAGLCVPANQALNSVAGQSTSVVVKTVGTSVVKEYVKDQVIETVSDTVTDHVADKLNLNQTQKVILGEVLEEGIDTGVDKVSDAYTKKHDGALDSDFTDGMSYEDAKRYNEFRNRDTNIPDSADLKRHNLKNIEVESADRFDTDLNQGDGTPKTVDSKPDMPQSSDGNALEAETYKADAPSNGDAPQTPKSDLPAADAPSKADAPSSGDAPQAPKSDLPAADAPSKADAPSSGDAPQAPKSDLPAADAPSKADAPSSGDAPQAPKSDLPAADAPSKADAPSSGDAPKADQPAADAPSKADAPSGGDAPQTPKSDLPAADAPSKGDAPSSGDAPQAPKSALPAADAPSKADAPSGGDAPQTPKSDLPAADAPSKADAPSSGDAPQAPKSDQPAADAPSKADAPSSGDAPQTPKSDLPAADTSGSENTKVDTTSTVNTEVSDGDVGRKTDYSEIDWENTANTPEELAEIREMEENGEFVVKKKSRNGRIIREDYGAPEVTAAAEPTPPSIRMPSKDQGEIIGDRSSRTFEFIPKNPETQKIMAKYGEDSIHIREGRADFSPFTKQDTPWGTVECEVEIGHMTGERDGTIHNPGNYQQADAELAKKISKDTEQEVTADQIKKYREDNSLTWHETEDCKTMQLVPYEINRDCAHTGGTAESKYVMSWGDISKDFGG